MSRNLGISDTPSAQRASAAGWRDPRLWIGVAIIAASMLAGALVLCTSDDSVPVWAVTDAMSAGQAVSAGDLTVRRVHFADSAAAALYLDADRPLPAGLTFLRGVGAGELLPRAAVGPGTDLSLRRVPISVAPDQVPRDVAAGALVDVYLRPSSHSGCQDAPVCSGRPALAGVSVLDAPPVDQEFGSDGGRMLVLGMTVRQAHRFFRLLASTDSPALTVVGRG